MNYFTEAWHRGDLDEERSDAASENYRQHLERLFPNLPPDVRMLANGVNLHDGLIRQLAAELESGTLVLTLNCGDLQTGYFDLELRYEGVLFNALDLAALAAIKEGPRCVALYDEVDVEGNGFVHRILFLAQGNVYVEVTIRFQQLRLRTTPRERR